MTRGFRAISGFYIALLAGCGDSVAGGGEEGGSESTGQASTTDATPTSGDESSSTGAPFEPFPARGDVVVSRVEVNPGVAIKIEENGAPVGGAERNAYLPKNRDTLFRVFLDVPDDWTPRRLEARLELSGGGVDTTYTDAFQIDGDTIDSKLDSGPFFGVRAEHVRPNVKYRVSLWEAEAGQEALPEPAVPAVSPADGPAYIGVESRLAELRVVLVPVDYAYGECAAAVDGEAERKSFEDALYQQNGVESLEFVVHAPYKVDYDLTAYNGLSKLVGEMSMLRSQEGADDNVYYYALFDNCSRCIGAGGGNGQNGCVVGLAFDITGPDKNDAYGRAAAGQLNGGADDTFVHEVGHTQGRRHIECVGGGDAAGTDPSYPYQGGVIDKWGFGVRDYRLRHPKTHADYMSYCGQTWASDWQWNATYKRIVELSSWSMAGEAAPTGPGQLVGTIEPDGTEMWWTVPGEFSADRVGATHALQFDFADGVVSAPAEVRVRPDHPTKIVVTGLPAGFDGRALSGLRMRDEQGERPIALDRVRWLHRPQAVSAGSPR